MNSGSQPPGIRPPSTIGFSVYIDESGDEGFVFKPDGVGSSRWFVLSAVVVRKETDMEVVRLVDDVRAALGREHRGPLHFRNLRHEQRLRYIDHIARAKLRTVSILVHKPSLQEPEKFAEKYLLYRYATRYLLERVSWLCRDHRKAPTDRARIYFSNRATMSYDDLRDYLRLLRDRTSPLDVRIDWSAVDPDDIQTRDHGQMMGLQIADAVASGLYFGVETSRYGFTEPRYGQMLGPVIYAHQGKRLGYGLKLWPREAEGLLDREKNIAWIKEGFR